MNFKIFVGVGGVLLQGLPGDSQSEQGDLGEPGPQVYVQN